MKTFTTGQRCSKTITETTGVEKKRYLKTKFFNPTLNPKPQIALNSKP